MFLAVIVDRVVAVIRRHVLARAEVPWAPLGRVLAAAGPRGLGLVALYLLRLVLARGDRRGPAQGGAQRGAAPGRPEARRPPEVPAIEPPDVTEPPELAGASKKARLAWWYRHDPDYGNRSAVAAAAKRLAPKVDLSRRDGPGLPRPDLR